MVEHRIALGHWVGPSRAAPIDAEGLLAPGRWTRARARARHAELDRAIAAGADLAASPLLAARAAQLTCPHMRRQLAAGLERAAATGDGSRPRFRVVPRRAAARHNRDALIELATILRAGTPAYARGIALVERVLADGAGPAYTDHDGAVLARRLRHARAYLAG